MALKEYRIVDATVVVKGNTIPKQNVEYYIDGVFVDKELYSIRGSVVTTIRVDYINEDTGKKELRNISDVDIESLTSEQITLLKARLAQ